MFVWVFMGDLPEEERPPIPDWPESSTTTDDTSAPSPASSSGSPTTSGSWRTAVDIAHTPFVHGGAFGNPEQPGGPGVRARELAVALQGRRSTLNPPRSKGIWGMLNPNKARTSPNRPPVPVSTTWWLPNMILLDVGCRWAS